MKRYLFLTAAVTVLTLALGSGCSKKKKKPFFFPPSTGSGTAPGQVVNPTPADNASDVSLTQILSWDNVSDADSYDVYLDTVSPPVAFIGNQPGLSYDPGGLVAAATYYWRIDAVNAYGNTSGIEWSFTTGSPPQQVVGPTPADTATDVLLTQILSWAAGSGATSYDVYFDTVSPPVTFIGNQPGLSYDPGGMAAGTNFYWRIDAVNAFGTTTGVEWSFTTGAFLPAQASNPAPVDTATGVLLDADLFWGAAAGATSYDVYFDTVSPPVAFIGNQPGLTFDPGGLTADTSYYWRIDTVNAFGTTTGVEWSFKTGAPPAMASNPVPADSIGNVSLAQVLSWDNVADADSYDVYFDTVSPPVAFIGNQLGNSYDPGGMASDTSFYWRIDTVNAFGTTTGVEWSLKTGIPPAQAAGPSPGDTATGVLLDADLSWGAAAGATSYDVYFDTVSPPVAFIGNQPGLTYDPGSMAAGTNFYWRIDAVNAYGTTAGVEWSFTTGSPPAQAAGPSPGDTATGVLLDADLFWGAAAGATIYGVYFGTSSPPPYVSDEAGITYDPGALATGTLYYWRIDTVNAYGNTTGIEWSFTTGTPPGQASTPVPADTAGNIPLAQILSWAAGSGATSYDVYLDTVSPPLAFQGNQPGLIFNPGGLAPDTSYYWRINAVNAFGTTAGNEWSFRTAAVPAQASNPTPADSTGNVSLAQILSWDNASNADSYDVYFDTVSPPVAFIGNQLGNSYDPGGMAPDTSFYWRIDTVNAFGTTVGVEWSFKTGAPPAQAAGPSPGDTATGVLLDADLSWGAAAGATSYDVYFDTVSPPVAFIGNQPGLTYDPGALATGTLYYWRIDTVNAYGNTTGIEWSFTTGSPPAQASNPTPADTAIDILLTQVLSWNAAAGATSYDVYFDTVSPPVTFIGNQPGIVFNPGGLAADTSYYWRIDAVNAYGTTAGIEWTFKTGVPPGQASTPVPADAAGNVLLTQILSWAAGSGATSYDVYLDIVSPPVAFQGNQPGLIFNPGGLAADTSYYWRIDAVNAYGTAAGNEWSFRTGAPPAQVTGPTPADNATDVPLNQVLSWPGAAGATSYDVYFDTVSPPVAFQGNQPGLIFNPGGLAADTSYYWRIDSVNAFGTTTGVEWSFLSYPGPGSLEFSKTAGAAAADDGRGIAVLPDGSAFVTGTFQGTATFDPGGPGQTSIASNGGSIDIFIAAYNADGSLNWVVKAGGALDDGGESISVLTDGSIYVTGYFRDDAVFDAGGANQTILTSAGQADIFIARYNSNGSLWWAKSAGSSRIDTSFSISAIPDGSAVITGEFRGSCTFGSGANQATLSSAVAKTDAFIARYTADGTLDWAVEAGGSKDDGGTAVAALADGSSVVTGFCQDATFDFGGTNQATTSTYGKLDIFIARYSPTGSLIWLQEAGSGNDERGTGIAVLTDGSVFVTGNFQGSAVFGAGNATLISFGGTDVFIARYNADGGLAWAEQAGSTAGDTGNDIGVLADGTVYLTGQYIGTGTFGTGANQAILTSNGGSADVFVACYSSGGILSWASSGGGPNVDDGLGIGVLPDGSCLVTGYYTGSAIFGAGQKAQTTLTAAGGAADTDIFIARFNP